MSPYDRWPPGALPASGPPSIGRSAAVSYSRLRTRRSRVAGAIPLWREYEALVRLRSPQLSIVRDRGRSRQGPLPAGRPYLVLDRIRARPLGTRRRSIGSLTRLTEGLGSALADIHDRGWLHRDIKPSNVLWEAKRRQAPVLIDLGLAVPIGQTCSYRGRSGRTRNQRYRQ